MRKKANEIDRHAAMSAFDNADEHSDPGLGAIAGQSFKAIQAERIVIDRQRIGQQGSSLNNEIRDGVDLMSRDLF